MSKKYKINKIKSKNIFTLDDKSYSGSGILILEKGPIPKVILFSSQHGVVEDLGGDIETKDFDDKNTLLATSLRESMEESCNLLHFNSGELTNYIDKKVSNKDVYYRAYVVSVLENVVTSRLFDFNRKTLEKRETPSVWKEMKSLVKFDLKEIENMINDKSTNCKSIDNIPYELRNRTIDILTILVKSKDYKEYMAHPVIFSISTNNKSDNEFLDGTIILESIK